MNTTYAANICLCSKARRRRTEFLNNFFLVFKSPNPRPPNLSVNRKKKKKLQGRLRQLFWDSLSLTAIQPGDEMFLPQITCSVTNPLSHSQPVIVCCTNSVTLHQFCHTSTSTEGTFPKRKSTEQHYNYHLFLVQLKKKNTGNAIEEEGCSHCSLQFKAKI